MEKAIKSVVETSRKTCCECNLVATPGSDYCDFCEPEKKRRFNEALINEAAGLHSEYDY